MSERDLIEAVLARLDKLEQPKVRAPDPTTFFVNAHSDGTLGGIRLSREEADRQSQRLGYVVPVPPKMAWPAPRVVYRLVVHVREAPR